MALSCRIIFLQTRLMIRLNSCFSESVTFDIVILYNNVVAITVGDENESLYFVGLLVSNLEWRESSLGSSDLIG